MLAVRSKALFSDAPDSKRTLARPVYELFTSRGSDLGRFQNTLSNGPPDLTSRFGRREMTVYQVE